MKQAYEAPTLAKRDALSQITAEYCGVSRVYGDCVNE